MHKENIYQIMHRQNSRKFMNMPLAFDKRRGRSFNYRKIFVSLRKSKYQTIHNKHAFIQSFKKYDMHDMQHTSRHMICMMCKLLGDTWMALNKPVGWSKVKINQNRIYTKLIKYLTN